MLGSTIGMASSSDEVSSFDVPIGKGSFPPYLEEKALMAIFVEGEIMDLETNLMVPPLAAMDVSFEPISASTSDQETAEQPSSPCLCGSCNLASLYKERTEPIILGVVATPLIP